MEYNSVNSLKGTASYSSTPSSSMSSLQTKKTVLSDRFLIGEELGRGAYGQVYKGMDTSTGDVVAIKQISLTGVSQENLQSVMGEIELLKTLKHKNIVKYIGSFKTRSHLYIILEFMENGALSSVIKPNRFGVFPETLVAIYIAQVLQGLAYLHDQGVVHRDIKGANILTTKEGLVKLADFGVAAKLGELEEHMCDELHQNVVGTPYWMAPEVIEMTQVTAASDIWSVGCLIIELLTGYPPYYDLQPMSALFRIVQDDHPPLPETISSLLEDFLLKCFQKDPAARPEARVLVNHEWIQFNRRTLRSSWSRAQGFKTRGGRQTEAHESVNSVVSRILRAEGSDDELSRASIDSSAMSVGGSMISAATRTIDAASGPLRTDTLPSPRSIPTGPMLFQRPGLTASQLGDHQMGTSAMASPRSAASAGGIRASQIAIELSASSQLPPGSALGSEPSVEDFPLLSPRDVGVASTLVGPDGGRLGASRGQELGTVPEHVSEPSGSPSDMWERDSSRRSDAAGAPSTSQTYIGSQLRYSHSPGGIDTGGPRSRVHPDSDRDSPLTSFLARLHGEGSGTPSGPGRPAGQNLMAWLDEGGMGLESSGRGRGNMLDGGDIASYLMSTESTAQTLTGMDAGESSFSIESKRKVRDCVKSLRPGIREANMTPIQACNSLAQLFSRQPESKQYFVAEGGILGAMELLDSDNPRVLDAAVDLVCAFTSNDTRLLESLCLVGIVPAVCRLLAQQAPGLERIRLKAAAFVQQLCFSKETTLQMFVACGGLRYLVTMVQDNVQDATTLTFTGVSCIWRVLEAYGALPINYICRIFSQAGLIPKLFAVIKQLINLVRNATKHMPSPSSPSALSHTFTKGGSEWGLEDVGMAGPGPGSRAATITSSALKTMGSPTFKDDELRTTPMNGEPQQPGHWRVNSVDQNGGGPGNSAVAGTAGQSRADWLLEKCTTLLLLLAHADAVVKGTMCSKDNLQSLLDCLQRLQMPHLLRIMKTMRWLSSEASVLPAIKDAGAISQLIPFIARDKDSAPARQELQLEALHTLYNICKFNKRVHLEVAATAGIVPHLCRYAAEAPLAVAPPGAADPLGQNGLLEARRTAVRSFVVPMLVGMASTSSSTRAKLWASNGLDIFLQLLSEEDLQLQIGILRALDTWLSEDHTRVEHKLIQRDAVSQLVDLFARVCRGRDMQSMPQMLDILKQMLGRSSKVAVAMATGGLVPPLLEPLASPPGGGAPILRAKLLEILRTLYEHYPRPKEFIMNYRIQEVLRRLLESDGRGEDAVKVEAQKLLNAFHINVLL